MDETLIHTYDIDEQKVDFYVRPYCREFLDNMKDHFEIIVFTAGLQDYADVVLDNLEVNNCITHRLYRQHMRQYNGKGVKDLRVLGRDLSKIILVDNLAKNFELQKENGYLIEDFVDSSEDTELEKLEEFLKIILSINPEDIRPYIKDKENLLQKYRKNPLLLRLFSD